MLVLGNKKKINKVVIEMEKFKTGNKEWDKELEQFRRDMKKVNNKLTVGAFWAMVNPLVEDYNGTREDFDMLLNTLEGMITDSDWFEE